MDFIQPKTNGPETAPGSESKHFKALYAVITLLALLVLLQGAGMIYLFTRPSHPIKAETPLPSEPAADRAADSQAWAQPPYARQPVYAYTPQTRARSSFADPFFGTDSFFEDALASMARMQERMSRMMDTSAADPFFSGFAGPVAVDLEDKGDAYVLTSDLPGLEKDQINISVNGNLLTLQGIRKSESSSQDQGSGYYAQERSYGSFSRTIALPGPVDEGAITASYKEGVLTVTLPKLKNAEGSKITVQ